MPLADGRSGTGTQSATRFQPDVHGRRSGRAYSLALGTRRVRPNGRDRVTAPAMTSVLDTAGVGSHVELPASTGWLQLITEGAAGASSCRAHHRAERCSTIASKPTAALSRSPAGSSRHRGAWRTVETIVAEDVCATGFDLHLDMRRRHARRSPTGGCRPAEPGCRGVALRSRFHLLARAALIQYPTLWWAGTRDRAPLHASAASRAAAATALVTGCQRRRPINAAGR